MKDYLYIWNEPKARFLYTAGIKFKELAPFFKTDRALLLIESQTDNGRYDRPSHFDYVGPDDIGKLAAEDIYSWGDFIWADYPALGPEPFSPPALPPEEVAELLYFAHAGRPLRNILIPTLGNQFLAYAHDDGWLLKLYYRDWSQVELLLRTMPGNKLGNLDLSELEAGKSAFWIEQGMVTVEEITFEIDDVYLRRRYPNGVKGMKPGEIA